MPKFDDSQIDTLAKLRKQEEENLAETLAGKYDLPYEDLRLYSVDPDVLRLVSETVAKEAELSPIKQVGQKVIVAIRNPNNQKTQDVIERLVDEGFDVSRAMVSRASLEHVWQRYADLSYAKRSEEGILDISGAKIQEKSREIQRVKDAAGAIQEALSLDSSRRTSRVIETIVAGALALRTSDIHIEPEAGDVRIRYRIDGVLVDVTKIDHETYELLRSRFKLLAGMKLNVKDAAQTGRFSIDVGGKDMEVRASILPDAYGESLVLRLLDPDTIAFDMEQLGIEPRLFDVLDREISRPNGMILTTGPTGSGKTTTLYAFLKRAHTPEEKIVTIEDPVEYHLPGIVQTQVDDEYTFATGLKETLRQDPDIIMVGEIREPEVASTAITAALTGHIVFSTLHTNNAAGAFPRLADLGVSPKTTSSAVRVVMAQRLVRRLKEASKIPVKLSGKDKEMVDAILDSLPDKSLIPENTTTVWEADAQPGPEAYKGRIGIFEAIVLDDEIAKLLESYPSDREIKDAAKSQGILTMEQDGILKALTGVTSLSELRRVLPLDQTAARLKRQKTRDKSASREKETEI